MPVLAALADLHLVVGVRWADTQRVLRWAVDLLRDRRPDGILLGGDIHDRRSLPEERNVVADILLAMAEVAEVCGCYGNHDPPADLDLYTRLGSQHPITFYAEPAVHVLGDVAIAVLPWDRSVLPDEQLHLPAAERRAAEEAAQRARLIDLGAQLAAAPARSRLALAHVMLREAKVRMGQPERRGRDFELTLAELGLLGADAYLLGHVHASQEFTIGSAPVFYPGSTTRRTYGEVERKYIALVHIEGSAVSVEWVELPVTPMILAEATWVEQEGGRWGWSTDLDALVADAAGADIRFTYAVDEEHRAAAALAAKDVMAALQQAGGKLLQPEEKLIPRTRARAPEIAQASGLEEKLSIALEQRGHPQGSPQHERVLALFRTLPSGRSAA